MSRRLSKAEGKLNGAREALGASISAPIKDRVAASIPSDLTEEVRRGIVDKLDLALVREVQRPTPVEVIEGLDGFHAFPEQDSNAWKKATVKILEAYRGARQVACERDPAVQAYEASLTRLYREELDQFGVDLGRPATQEVEQAALRLARRQIGPPPRASLRFIVEAFWITIEILMLLGTATSKASEEIRSGNTDPVDPSAWEKLAEFLLLRAANDAYVACQLSIGSESWNKAVKCQLLLFRTRYELVSHKCKTAIGTGANSDPETKAELVDMCRQGIAQLKQSQVDVPYDYLSHWVSSDRAAKQEWVQTNFVQPSNVLLESWESLKRSAKGGTWYQEVTNEERTAILNAMMRGAGSDRLWHTGHFYQCPNGHPYVIGECGGAMQASRCPECGAAIGGSSHQATAGNTHATEFVNLARQGGFRDAGYTWGPNGGRGRF